MADTQLERVLAAALAGMLDSLRWTAGDELDVRHRLRDLGLEGADLDSLAGFFSANSASLAALDTSLPDLTAKLNAKADLGEFLAPLMELVKSVTDLADDAPAIALPDLPGVDNPFDYLLSSSLDSSLRSLSPGLWGFLRSVNLLGPDISVAATFEALLTSPFATMWSNLKSRRRNAIITLTGLLSGPRTTSIVTMPVGDGDKVAAEVAAVLSDAAITVSQVVVGVAADTFDDPATFTFEVIGDASQPPGFVAVVVRTDVQPQPVKLGKHVTLALDPPTLPLGVALTGAGEVKAITSAQRPTVKVSTDVGTLDLALGSPGDLQVKLGQPVLDLDIGLDSWGAAFGFGQFEISIPQSIAPAPLSLLIPSSGINLRGRLVGRIDEHGVHLDGGVGLVTVWPDTVKLPGLTVHSVTTELALGNEISLAAYGTLVVQLGPVTATIKGLGLSQSAQIRGDGTGNLGFVELPLPELRRPTGFGVSVDAGLLKGGGFLDIGEHEISGALELALALGPVQVSVHAIAVFGDIDGDVTFLIAIGAEFTPAIELFLGLTLNGVGGVFGLNRTLDTEALGALVRSGRMNDLMFPRDLAARAPEIIASAKQVFPARRDQYVVGPMLKLGWGRPRSFVTLSLGLVLTFPDPTIVAIIGDLQLGLPDQDLPIIDLHCGFAGGVNFSTGDLWFDASLERSHIGTFDVSGDLCLRAGTSGFVFSAGGFHPRFTPPPGVPALRRLAIAMAPYPVLRVRAEAYFAITGSTVQLGAKLFVVAKLGPIGASGDIGLDVLIQTEPRFHFVAELTGHFELTAGGYELCGVAIDVLLEGPGQWHARAHASITFLFVSFSGTLDVSWGADPSDERPAIDAAKVVHDALDADHVWAHVVPALDAGVAQIRQGASALHPLGALRLTQTAAPVGVHLDHFGANPVTSPDPVAVTVTAAGAAAPSAAQELFAAGQYFELTDDERLSKPAFQPFDAGYLVTGDSWSVAPGAVTVDVEYEESTSDDPPRGLRDRVFGTLDEAMLGWSVTSAAGLGRAHLVDPAPVRGITVTDVQYVVADAETGGLVAAAAGQVSTTSMARSADRVVMGTYESAVLR